MELRIAANLWASEKSSNPGTNIVVTQEAEGQISDLQINTDPFRCLLLENRSAY